MGASIEVTCNGCKRAFRVPADRAGQTGRCPGCGARTLIPNAPPPAPAASVAAAPLAPTATPAPIELDDAEANDRPRRRRRPAEQPNGPPQVVTILPLSLIRGAWLLALCAGAGAVLIGFNSNAIWMSAFSGLGCFLGIVARIIQAEETRLIDDGWRRWRERAGSSTPNRSTGV